MKNIDTGRHYPIVLENFPTDWEVGYVGDFADKIDSGFSSGIHNQNGIGIPHIRPMNISISGLLNKSIIKYVDAKKNAKRLKKNDVLFNNTNSPELVGKTTVINSDDNMGFSNHMTRIVFSKKVYPKFAAMQLHYLCTTGYFMMNCIKHVNQASISSSMLSARIPFFNPPLSQQKQIANKIEKMFVRLDKVSDCLKRIKQNITYARNAYLERSFPSIGVMKIFDDVATVTAGNPAPQNKKYFIDGKHFFVRVKDMGKLGNAIKINHTKDLINDEGVKKLKIFPKGSVLFTKSGASTMLNQRAILGEDMYVVSHIGIAMPKKITTSEWLYFYLKNKDFGKIAHSTVMPSLPLSKIRSMPIAIPPLAEQKRIVKKIEKMFTQLDKISQNVDNAEKYVKILKQKVLDNFF